MGIGKLRVRVNEGNHGYAFPAFDRIGCGCVDRQRGFDDCRRGEEQGRLSESPCAGFFLSDELDAFDESDRCGALIAIRETVP